MVSKPFISPNPNRCKNFNRRNILHISRIKPLFQHRHRTREEILQPLLIYYQRFISHCLPNDNSFWSSSKGWRVSFKLIDFNWYFLQNPCHYRLFPTNYFTNFLNLLITLLFYHLLYTKSNYFFPLLYRAY